MPKEMRLEPPIEVDTPDGRAYAFFKTDYTMHGNVVWGCVLKETGGFWWYENPKILLAPCKTFGIRLAEIEQREKQDKAEKNQAPTEAVTTVCPDGAKYKMPWFTSLWGK